MATPNVFTDCRFCLEKKRHVLPINEEMSNVYFSVTQMKLAKLFSYSNSVCLLCYKKLLSAQSYREMLIQIENKLLTTFNHTTTHLTNKSQPAQQQQQVMISSSSNNRAIRSNGAPSTPLVPIPTNQNLDTSVRKFARQQIKQQSVQASVDDDEDMSLLEEIVSIDAPNVSDFFNETTDHSNLYNPMASDDDDEDVKDEEDDEEYLPSFKVKNEPQDESSPIAVNDSNNGYQRAYPEKPYKCTVAGCRQSSTTRSALQKHRRRVHGIRVRQSFPGGKITRSKPSQLYNDLDLSSNVFKCKFCNLNLRNRRVLLRHIETVHMQAKFYCTVEGCNHASTRKDNYRLHLKNYHRDLPEIDMERVLNETRNMKPVYANNLTDLQMKSAMEEVHGHSDNHAGVKKEDEADEDDSSQSKNEEMTGFSFINIGDEDDEIL